MTTPKPTPWDSEIALLESRRPLSDAEVSRLGYLLFWRGAYLRGHDEALADVHKAAPCEWQLAMLNLPLLGAGGELVDNPQRCGEIISERYRTVHDALITAKKQIADVQPRIDALVAALRNLLASPRSVIAACPAHYSSQPCGCGWHDAEAQARAALKLAEDS